MTRVRNGKHSTATLDEGLYNKAKMLQRAKTEEFKNIIVMLGGFHTQMTFTKSHRKLLGVITNVRHMGGKRSFWRNYRWKHTERKAVEPCHTSSQAALRGALEGSLASLVKGDTGNKEKMQTKHSLTFQ